MGEGGLHPLGRELVRNAGDGGGHGSGSGGGDWRWWWDRGGVQVVDHLGLCLGDCLRDRLGDRLLHAHLGEWRGWCQRCG